MSTAPTRPTDDELRSSLRAIAAWAEPTSDPQLPSATTVVRLDGPTGLARPTWPRLAAAAIIVVGVLVAGVLVLSQRPAPVAEPGLGGILDRLPGNIVQLDVLDVEALRSTEEGEDPEAAAKAEVLLGQLELDPTLGVALAATDEILQLDLGAIRAVARTSVGPGAAVAVVATTQDAAALAVALRDAGFEEAEEGTFLRAASGDRGPSARAVLASIEPGYLTVAASVSPEVPVLSAADGPSEALRAVLSVAEPFLVLSARVDPSAATGATCGGAEAVTWGRTGYALVLLRGDEGRVVTDSEGAPGVLGMGRTGATKSDGAIAVVEVIPGEIGRISSYPLGRLTGDVGSLVDCSRP